VSWRKEGNTGQEDLVGQAAEWMACVTDPEASASDFRDWQEWLNTSPAHAAAYQQIEQVWALTGQAKARPVERARSSPPPAEGAGSSPQPAEMPAEVRIGSLAEVSAEVRTGSLAGSDSRSESRSHAQGVRRRRRPAMLVASAAALVAAAVGIGVWMFPGRHATYVLETATAEQRSMQLADGSHLVVGAETKVSVDLTATRRSLTLDHGIAYFKVAPDKSRPFVVASDGYIAQAVGTAFSVDAQPGRMLVTVGEGVVKVSRAAEAEQSSGAASPTLVHAGQRVSVDDAGIRCSMVPSSSGGAPSWISGRLEYLHEELRFVIADVNRYSRRKIVLDDAQIGRHLYTGTVLLEHVDEWVTTLPGSFPVRVGTDSAERFVLYSAGEQTFDRDDRGLTDPRQQGLEAGC
jgi:transmembrane sensor